MVAPPVTNIIVSISVTNIASSAFLNCWSLIAITVDALNPAYSSVDGVLFNKSQTALLAYPNGKAGAYTIPDGVTTIGESGFFLCYYVTGVIVPNSVTNIGLFGFLSCGEMTMISVDVLNPVYSSSDGVLFDKAQTTLIQNPFSKADTFYTIPSSVTNILKCTSSCLTNIAIGTNVVDIGFEAFDGCTSLIAITMDALNPFYSSVDGVLFNENQTALIQYPGGKAGSYTIPSTVTTIGTNAFNSRNLTSVIIPDSVLNIEDEAFWGDKKSDQRHHWQWPNQHWGTMLSSLAAI